MDSKELNRERARAVRSGERADPVWDRVQAFLGQPHAEIGAQTKVVARVLLWHQYGIGVGIEEYGRNSAREVLAARVHLVTLASHILQCSLDDLLEFVRFKNAPRDD